MPTTISLLTGEEVDTSSEAWRHECECSWLLGNKPTRADKHLHLYGVWDRDQLLAFNPASGKHELAEDWAKRIPADARPLIKFRGLAAADRILADAKRLWEIREGKQRDDAT